MLLDDQSFEAPKSVIKQLYPELIAALALLLLVALEAPPLALLLLVALKAPPLALFLLVAFEAAMTAAQDLEVLEVLEVLGHLPGLKPLSQKTKIREYLETEEPS
jgi:hypothetical protein